MTDPRRAVVMYLREREAARELAPQTVRNTRYVLLRFADACPPDTTKINRRHVIRWMDRHKHLGDATMAYHLGLVRSFCKWLVVTKRIVRDPTLTVDGPKRPRRRPRAMPYETVADVLDQTTDARLRAAICLMVMEGLRLNEVATLQLADIDFDRRLLNVIGKGNKERVLPLTDASSAAIRVYLTESPAQTGPLIRSLHDGRSPITSGRLGRLVTAAMREAGAKNYNGDGRSPHAFRHTAATDTLAAGASITQVRDMLGHENVATTQIYLAPGDAEALRAPMEARSYSTRLRPVREA